MDRRFQRAARSSAWMLALCAPSSVTTAQEAETGRYPWTAEAAAVAGQYLALGKHVPIEAERSADRYGVGLTAAEVLPATAMAFGGNIRHILDDLDRQRWRREHAQDRHQSVALGVLRSNALPLRTTRESYKGVPVVQLKPGQLGKTMYSAPGVPNLRGTEIAIRDPVLKGFRADSIRLSRSLTPLGKLHTFVHEDSHYRFLKLSPRVFTENQFKFPAYFDQLASMSTGQSRRVSDLALYARRAPVTRPDGSTWFRDITFRERKYDVTREVLRLGKASYKDATGSTLVIDTTGLIGRNAIGKQLAELRTWQSVRPLDFLGTDPHSLLREARNPREWGHGMNILRSVGYDIDKSPLTQGTYTFTHPAQNLSRIDPHSYLDGASGPRSWVQRMGTLQTAGHSIVKSPMTHGAYTFTNSSPASFGSSSTFRMQMNQQLRLNALGPPNSGGSQRMTNNTLRRISLKSGP